MANDHRNASFDARIVDFLQKMKPGKWYVTVHPVDNSGLGMPMMPHEGGQTIRFDDTEVCIYPHMPWWDREEKA